MILNGAAKTQTPKSVACVHVAGGILSRVRQWRRSRQFSRLRREIQSGSFPFSSRLRRPYSLSAVKILPRTRTIPPATQATKSAAQIFAIRRLHGVRISRQRVRVATNKLFPNRPGQMISAGEEECGKKDVKLRGTLWQSLIRRRWSNV